MQPTLDNQPSSRKRVLIAEDNEDIMIVFSYALTSKFEVKMAKNGQEALDMIEQEVPDLLVLDINMPKVSGLDVLERLRQRHLASNMKIIVATGNSIAATDPIMDYADMTLLKPVSPYQLVSLAERLLS